MVFRDALLKENLWWEFVLDEKVETYMKDREILLALGYTFNCVTCDGLPGLINVFKNIPVQFCHFHQTQIVRRYVTENPKLIQGYELLEFMKSLTFTDETIFKHRLSIYIDKHREFLNEKSMDLKSGIPQYTHRRLRSALRSLAHNIPYLFTYQKYPQSNIPNTADTLESHFSHIKDIVRIHRGMKKLFKQKMIHTILLNSSIVLKSKRKE